MSTIHIICDFGREEVELPIESKDILKYIDESDLTVIDKKYKFKYVPKYELFMFHLMSNIDIKAIKVNSGYHHLLEGIEIINKYVENSVGTKNVALIMNSWIHEIFSINNWRSLSNHRDFSSYIIQKRCWPYFNSFSPVWKKINKILRERDYPLELVRNDKTSADIFNKKTLPDIGQNIGKFSKDEQKHILANTYHNYKYIQIVNTSDYEQVDNMLQCMQILWNLKMYNVLLGYAFAKCVDFTTAHIVKNKEFWNIMDKLNTKIASIPNYDYNLLLAYFAYYAFYIIKQEEFITFSHYVPGSRILYDLDDAHSLRDFSNIRFENHPMVNIMPGNNYKTKTMPYYLGLAGRKINNMSAFIKRFNWITRNAFEGIDLSAFKANITGSILIPCAATNPLEERFEGFHIFNYLSKCEIDKIRDKRQEPPPPYKDDAEMSKSQDEEEIHKCDIEYDDSFDVISNFMNGNANKLNSWKNDVIVERFENAENKEEDAFMNYVECFYPSYRSLSESNYQKMTLECPYGIDEYESYRDKDLKEKYDWEERRKKVMSNIKAKTLFKEGQNKEGQNKERVSISKKILLPMKSRSPNGIEMQETRKEREKKEEEEKNQTIIPGFNLLSDVDIGIHAADYNDFKVLAYSLFEKIRDNVKNYGPIYITKNVTITNFKYTVSGPGLIRPIDIFCIYKTPEKLVKSFHLAAVRMFYDGKKVKLFQSCVSSLLTGINHTYKWMSCNKVPGDIILKYAQRGYSTVMNTVETKAIIEYIKKDKRWNKHLNYANGVMGTYSTNNTFFYPDHFNFGIRLNLDENKVWRTCEEKYSNYIIHMSPPWSKINHFGTIDTLNERKDSIAVPCSATLNSILELA